jgi:hypothetical protein
MISGAIQTCSYFLTGEEKSENKESVATWKRDCVWRFE